MKMAKTTTKIAYSRK